VGDAVTVEATTVRVTGTLRGLLVASGEVKVIEPLYVPGARLPGATETETVPGVLPELLPLAMSQLPPLGVATAAETEYGMTPPVLVTFNVCGGDEVLPVAPVKLSDVGDTEKAPTGCAAVTFKVTLQTKTAPTSGADTAATPVYVPTARPAGLTESDRIAGTLGVATVLLREAVNHGEPSVWTASDRVSSAEMP